MFINYSNISKSELFSNIPVADIPKAINCLNGYTKDFSANESIFKANGKYNYSGIVLNGNLSENQLFPDGSNVLIRSIGQGELFAYSGDNSTYITATEKSTILFLKLPAITETNYCNCKYHTIIMENFIRILIRNNKYLNQKIKIVSRHTIREKLILFFQLLSTKQKSNTIKLNMSHEKLADAICSERSAVSRELSNMKRDNLIEKNGKYIKLKDTSN